ncbi:MAG: hypothetical protein WAM63_20565, partial [Rhodomicrobium sp.]
RFAALCMEKQFAARPHGGKPETFARRHRQASSLPARSANATGKLFWAHCLAPNWHGEAERQPSTKGAAL